MNYRNSQSTLPSIEGLLCARMRLFSAWENLATIVAMAIIVAKLATIVASVWSTLEHQISDPKLSSDFEILFPAQDESHLEGHVDGFPWLSPCTQLRVLKTKMSSNKLFFGTPLILRKTRGWVSGWGYRNLTKEFSWRVLNMNRQKMSYQAGWGWVGTPKISEKRLT